MNEKKVDETSRGCSTIDTEYVAPGWGCCQCHTYNRAGRMKCKVCGHMPCGIPEAELTRLRAKEAAMFPELRSRP